MNPKTLKRIRQTVAVIVLAVATFFFIDFAGVLPYQLHGLLHLQFVPALFSGMFGLVVLIIVLTLLFGRVYCSMLCPLGILMDVSAKTSGRGKKKNFKDKTKRYSYTTPHNVFRYSILVVSIVSVFVAGLNILMWIDPYSNFGRIAANVFMPVYMLVNNVLTVILEFFGSHALYKVSFTAFSWFTVGFSLGFLILVGLMSYLRGRLYCNSTCPVGTFLGLFSRFSLFKIRIDQSKCTSCGLCQMSCKSSCIDSKSKTVDNSRCVACFNCINGMCKGGGITFSTPSKKKQDSPKINDAPDNQSRGEFLATIGAVALTVPLTAMAKVSGSQEKVCSLASTCKNGKTCDFDLPCFTQLEKLPVCPAGSLGIEEFNNKCTACNLCIVKCPSKVLRPAFSEYGMKGFMQPVMRYRDGKFCAYDCNVCSQVCPVGAIRPLSIEQKHSVQIGIAHFLKSKCVVDLHGYDCGACAEHCPTAAVKMVEYKDGLLIPQVTEDLCVGCGACEQICPESAIIVFGNKTHKKASPPKKEEALDVSLDDFGF